MALVVEDGTGLASANSYVTRADADAYFADRGVSAWASASEAARDAALIDATAYIDGRYTWVGAILKDAQALDWPRRDARDRDGRKLTGVPTAVARAVYEIAYDFAVNGRPSATDPNGSVKMKREKAGPVEEETEFFPNQRQTRTYPHVDRLLAGLVRYLANQQPLLRG